jgi:hypothetical protein
MSGSKPKLKVITLDEMFKKISESSENDSFLDSDVKKRVKNKLCFILSQDKDFEDKMNCQFQRVS